MDDLLFINPDLTIHLRRLPVGEWVCLEATQPLRARRHRHRRERPVRRGRPDRPVDRSRSCSTAADAHARRRHRRPRRPRQVDARPRPHRHRSRPLRPRRSAAASPSISGSRGRRCRRATASAFVDVPGHVRFLKNMLAGVGAVDACLFVVAATEGWKPQSEEHLRILELLGVRHGVVALTKVGLVDDEYVELARLDVTDHVAGTFLDVRRDRRRRRAHRGRARRATARARPHAGRTRRPQSTAIDRASGSTVSFAAPGAGTVVTGTLTGGRLRVGDELDRRAPAPAEQPVRVRGLQSLGQSHDTTRTRQPGRGEPRRRRTTTRSAAATPSSGLANGTARRRSTRRSHVLASLDHDVSRRGAFVAYIGSGEHAVRLRILGPDSARSRRSTGSLDCTCRAPSR